jgi:hypothetical protein
LGKGKNKEKNKSEKKTELEFSVAVTFDSDDDDLPDIGQFAASMKTPKAKTKGTRESSRQREVNVEDTPKPPKVGLSSSSSSTTLKSAEEHPLLRARNRKRQDGTTAR